MTALRFDLDGPATVRLQVFDVTGRLVREILPGHPLPGGIYVYQVETAVKREVGRVVLAR